MKSTQQVIKENPQFKSLINAVVKQLGGTESFEDIRNHGISGGFSGFTYYNETVPFAMKNRKQIVELLEERAAQLGEEVVNMVSGFGLFRIHKMDNEDKLELYNFMCGRKCRGVSMPNLMAWFAAEEVARMFEA